MFKENFYPDMLLEAAVLKGAKVSGHKTKLDIFYKTWYYFKLLSRSIFS